MHTLGSSHPARSRRHRRRTVALVAGCSLAAATAFALPAFAGNGPAPKEDEVVVVGCAIADDGTAVPPEAVAMPLPSGAKVISGRAVAVDGGRVVAPERVPLPTMPAERGTDLIATATIGSDGTVTVRGGGGLTAPTTTPQVTFSAVPGRPGTVKGDATDTGTGSVPVPKDGTVIEFDVADLPDCGAAAE